ncbi:hypothetical protein SedNR2807_34610 [Citrobacter sedlakii]
MDLDDPGDNPLARAAAQRAQPKPHHTSTAAAPALRYRSQPDKTQGLLAYAPGKAVSVLGF